MSRSVRSAPGEFSEKERVSFAYFSLAQQRKVSRPTGETPNDGMNLYRGYFVPNGVDWSGEKNISSPVYRTPGTNQGYIWRAWKDENETRIFGTFGGPSVTGRKVTNHDGVDLLAPSGTDVYAAADGKVVGAYETTTGKRGKHIIIFHECIKEHKAKSRKKAKTVYYHLSSLKVVYNQKVKRGQLIAFSGNTGNAYYLAGKDGQHLHFEYQPYNGTYISTHPKNILPIQLDDSISANVKVGLKGLPHWEPPK